MLMNLAFAGSIMQSLKLHRYPKHLSRCFSAPTSPNSNNDIDEQSRKQLSSQQRTIAIPPPPPPYKSNLHSFPTPPSLDFLLSRSRKASLKVETPTPQKVPNAKQRAQKTASIKINKYGETIGRYVKECIEGYRTLLKNPMLSSFERVCIDLTLSAKIDRDGVDLRKLIVDLDQKRKGFTKITKEYSGGAKKCPTAKEANEWKNEGIKTLEEYLIDEIEPMLKVLKEIGKSLRTTPVVDPNVPTIVLVGSPNVGKSSIVRRVSSGNPEVAGYAFTTRGLTIGHLDIVREGREDLRCQVMDSPGLLVREGVSNDYDEFEVSTNKNDETKRNPMELLTLASIATLPTAVCFVFDLSETAGERHSSIDAQLRLRQKLRKRFPKRPWFDVVAKCDLLGSEFFSEGPTTNDIRRQLSDINAIYVSVGGEEADDEKKFHEEFQRQLQLTKLDDLRVSFGEALIDVSLVLEAIK